MKCKICDTTLTNSESVTKNRLTGEYLDTCSVCQTFHYMTMGEFSVDEVFSISHVEIDNTLQEDLQSTIIFLRD